MHGESANHEHACRNLESSTAAPQCLHRTLHDLRRRLISLGDDIRHLPPGDRNHVEILLPGVIEEGRIAQRCVERLPERRESILTNRVLWPAEIGTSATASGRERRTSCC